MIVVIASSYDDVARTIVAHWGNECAALLTAEDLCRPGWSLSVPATLSGTAVIAGQIVSTADITGILTLRSSIWPQELSNITLTDRSYVSAELNAFLLAWLKERTCPIINRPSASCLAGPNWRAEQWTQAAARLDIPVRACERHVPCHLSREKEEETAQVTVAGERCFGHSNPTFSSWALQLARASGTDLLSAYFSLAEGCFLTANPWPHLSDPSILTAVKERLEGKL